jgi:hypothetical protein
LKKCEYLPPPKKEKRKNTVWNMMYHFLFGIVHLYGVLNKRRGGKNFGGWVNTCCIPKKTIEEKEKRTRVGPPHVQSLHCNHFLPSGILYFNGQRGPGNSIGHWEPCLY